MLIDYFLSLNLSNVCDIPVMIITWKIIMFIPEVLDIFMSTYIGSWIGKQYITILWNLLIIPPKCIALVVKYVSPKFCDISGFDTAVMCL